MSSHKIIVEVLGIPDNLSKEKLSLFSKQVRLAVAGMEDLEVAPQDVVCFFHRDHSREGLGEKIIFKYGTTSTALLDSNWKFTVSFKVEKIAREFFPEALIESIE